MPVLAHTLIPLPNQLQESIPRGLKLWYTFLFYWFLSRIDLYRFDFFIYRTVTVRNSTMGRIPPQISQFYSFQLTSQTDCSADIRSHYGEYTLNMLCG